MNRGTLIMSRGAIENTMTTMRRDDTRGSTTRVSYPRVVSPLCSQTSCHLGPSSSFGSVAMLLAVRRPAILKVFSIT